MLIQGQVEAFKTGSLANVRTPYSREALRAILAETGWSIERETLVDASALDDAAWEIDAALGDSLAEATTLDLPARLQTLLASQGDVLRRVAARDGNRAAAGLLLVARARRPDSALRVRWHSDRTRCVHNAGESVRRPLRRRFPAPSHSVYTSVLPTK